MRIVKLNLQPAQGGKRGRGGSDGEEMLILVDIKRKDKQPCAAAEASKRDHLDGEKAKHGWHGVRGVYEKHRVAGF